MRVDVTLISLELRVKPLGYYPQDDSWAVNLTSGEVIILGNQIRQMLRDNGKVGLDHDGLHGCVGAGGSSDDVGAGGSSDDAGGGGSSDDVGAGGSSDDVGAGGSSGDVLLHTICW